MSITETTIFDEFERTGLISDLKCIYLGRWNVFYTHIDHTYQVGRPGDTRKAPNWHSDNIVAMCTAGRGYTTDLCQGGRSNDRLAHPAAYAPVELNPSEEATDQPTH